MVTQYLKKIKFINTISFERKQKNSKNGTFVFGKYKQNKKSNSIIPLAWKENKKK